MDKAILSRIYSTSILLSMLVAIIFMINQAYDWGLLALIGSLTGVGLLKSTELLVLRFLAQKGSKLIYFAFLAKYIFAGLIIYVLLQFPAVNMLGFVLGFGLVQLVIVLKATGKLLAETT